MHILKFNAKEVAAQVEHARQAPEHSPTFSMQFESQYWKDPNAKMSDDEIFGAKGEHMDMSKIPAGLHLVHDQGVYIMSNGSPRMIRPDSDVSSVVCYADECDPEKDEDWYETARVMVGGDDFAEHLPIDWWDSYLAKYPKMNKPFKIGVSSDNIKLVL